MNDGKLVGRTKVTSHLLNVMTYLHVPLTCTNHAIYPCKCFQALSTNMLYYSGYKIGAMMGKELGIEVKEIHDLEEKANLLKATIQKR